MSKSGMLESPRCDHCDEDFSFDQLVVLAPPAVDGELVCARCVEIVYVEPWRSSCGKIDRAALAKIDENLIRSYLTPAQRPTHRSISPFNSIGCGTWGIARKWRRVLTASKAGTTKLDWFPMRTAFFSAFALFTACSIGNAAPLTALAQTEVIRFAAVTVSDGLGMRAVISNVIPSGTDANVAPCKVQVKFFGADGALVGNAGTLQLKPGASGSVTANGASSLVRTAISIDGSSDASKVCELRARVEIFELHTGATFFSVAADPDSASECAMTSSIANRKISKQMIPAAVIPTSPHPVTSHTTIVAPAEVPKN